MSGYDLVVSRPPREAVNERFGEVLLGEPGVAPSDLAALLNDGHVRLRLGADFERVNGYSRQLEAVGALVQILPAGEATPPHGFQLVDLAGNHDEAPVEIPTGAGVGRSSGDGLAPGPHTPGAPALPGLPGWPGWQEEAVAIELPVEPPPGARSKPPPAPRCLTCLAPLPSPDAPCEQCQPRPSSSFFAGLRGARARRLALGLGVALVAGRLLSYPYERHAERSVATMEQEASVLRARLDPRLQAEGAALAEQAHGEAQAVAVKVGVLWLLIAAAAMALWLAL